MPLNGFVQPVVGFANRASITNVIFDDLRQGFERQALRFEGSFVVENCVVNGGNFSMEMLKKPAPFEIRGLKMRNKRLKKTRRHFSTLQSQVFYVYYYWTRRQR